ncbi:FtsQ-type POTRA domain-containing protein [Microbacterium fluvii]|uniref:FtsQ-type POTRA domain-containing protein n=1 Tax=Microbacterium fluvii TaxID=415215 RepID=A0ABW2HFZ4_9MICO|nr:FtsQ-type POTRA domain-containing protein [Microbacterium fluvii]MCU4673642.1 FtsQ-type POTRA domain-containing protein [Microbacterium fluvii]
MRRPSPLPPTSTRAPERGAAGEPIEISAAFASGAGIGGADAAASPAEVDSDELRWSRPEAAETFGAVPPSAEAEDAPVRLRDVWGAAWARRRALRAEVRRFTVRQRHRRAIWLGAGASLLALVLVTLGAAYSPLFGVEKIHVVGAEQLDADTVAAALRDQVGRPLPLVDESAVKAALVKFPLVQSYTLEARPPHELVVRIVERTPIGVIESAAGYTLVDAAGVSLSTTQEPAAGSPLLKVAGGVGSAAFDAAGQVMRTLPESIRDQVTKVTATSADDVTLRLGDTRTDIVWGSADDSATKAVVLAAAMKAKPPKSVSGYDVSSPEAVVIW